MHEEGQTIILSRVEFLYYFKNKVHLLCFPDRTK